MNAKRKYLVEGEVCGSCAHYRQHYVLGVHGRWQPLWYGHCHKPLPCYPTPEGSCPHWTPHEKEAVIP